LVDCQIPVSSFFALLALNVVGCQTFLTLEVRMDTATAQWPHDEALVNSLCVYLNLLVFG